MSVLSTPSPAKLIVGMLSGRRELLDAAAERLARDYGRIDIASEVMDFAFTDYYEKEMGVDLLRQFVAFERLIRPDAIAGIKRATSDIEAEFAKPPKPGSSGVAELITASPDAPPRPVNLDPGYVTESKLILASTKDYCHRIYLTEGIYAEVTLMYTGGGWTSHERTFPDYASGAYDAFLNRVRDSLRGQLRRKEQGG